MELDQSIWNLRNEAELARLELDEQVEQFREDALSLSWASYRYWIETGHRWREIRDCEATERDHEMAALTRSYFRNKIMMRMIKDQPLSNFQKDLYDMLCGPVRRKHMGMLYRLPYFYAEDHEKLRLCDQYPPVTDEQYQSKRGVQSLTLTPVTAILCSRKRDEVTQYWFRDQDQVPVCWSVSSTNALGSLIKGLWDRSLEQETPIVIRARAVWQGQRAGWPYIQPDCAQLESF